MKELPTSSRRGGKGRTPYPRNSWASPSVVRRGFTWEPRFPHHRTSLISTRELYTADSSNCPYWLQKNLHKTSKALDDSEPLSFPMNMPELVSCKYMPRSLNMWTRHMQTFSCHCSNFRSMSLSDNEFHFS